MTKLTSQELRNAYESFYVSMRNYLWPYDVLVELSNVEVDIYKAFINMSELEMHFAKLQTSIKDACKEDEELRKATKRLANLIDSRDVEIYHKVFRVSETNPTKTKVLNPLSKEED